MKEQINTTNAPAAIGPYSQAIRKGNLLFTSGQLPLDPETGALREGTVEERVHQALSNLQAVVTEAGATMDDVVKTTVYLADLADWPAANQVYSEFFKQPFPARSAFQVAALPLGAVIEIEAIVVLD